MPLIGTSTSASAKGYGMLASGYPVAGNPSFNNVSLLLHGDGTNGAQNNTFLDSSSNALSITRSGSTTQGSFNPFGPNGWSGYFDGSSIATVANTTALDLSGQFTVEFWVNFPSKPTDLRAIGGKWASGKLAWLVQFNGSTNQLIWLGGTGAGFGATLSNSWTPTANIWYHIAFSRDASGTVRAFIDGTQLPSTLTSNTDNNTSATSFGVGGNPDGSIQLITAYISNFRVVKGTAVYTANFTPSTAPLTAITNTSLLTLQDNRFKDNSTNSFTLTATGSPQIQPVSPFVSGIDYSPATHGGSAYFGGSNDYLRFPVSNNFVFGTGDFTIEMYCYLIGSGTYQLIYDFRSGIADDAFFIGRESTRGFYCNNNTAGDFLSSGNGTAPLYTWHHLVVSRVGTTMRMFLNGIQVSSVTKSTNFSNTTAPALGTSTQAIGVDSTVGYVSSVRILKGVGVTSVTVPTAPLTNIAGTVLLLNFTNAGIFDSSAKNNLITAGSAQVSSAQVKFGTGSMLFNGTTDYLTIPASANMNIGTGNFTLETWINPTNFTTVRVLASFANTYVFYFNTSGIPYYGIFGVAGSDVAFGTTPVPSGSWSHVAFVRNGTNITCYINGLSVGSITPAQSQIGNSTSNNYIGIHQNANYWNGYIDDLRITKGVAVYTQNFTPYPQAFPNS